MSEPREAQPAVRTFGAKLSAFHASLEPDEQRLLEMMVMLAERASEQDTGGFAWWLAAQEGAGEGYDPWKAAPALAAALGALHSTA